MSKERQPRWITIEWKIQIQWDEDPDELPERILEAWDNCVSDELLDYAVVQSMTPAVKCIGEPGGLP